MPPLPVFNYVSRTKWRIEVYYGRYADHFQYRICHERNSGKIEVDVEFECSGKEQRVNWIS